MAMKPDVTLAAGVWHDFYAATGYAPGTDVIFCNRSGTRVLAFEGAQPAAQAYQGAEIASGAWGRVKADSAWIKAGAPILLGAVQEFAE